VIHLTLPWPPSVNHYWRHVPMGRRGVRVLVSAEGRRYQAAVRGLCEGIPPVHGAVSICLFAAFPDRRKRDIDNILKSVLDSIVRAGIIDGDEFIVTLRAEKEYSAENPRVAVAIAHDALATVTEAGAWM